MAYIYKITNLKNNKIYIGQTKRHWSVRRSDHRYRLKKGDHRNPHLQSSYNKYGPDAFKFEVLEKCSISKVDERECYWINKYNSRNRLLGYNLEKGGNENKELSDETRAKMSKAQQGNNGLFNEKEVEKIKIQLINGKTPTEIARELGVKKDNISRILYRTTYVWVRPDLNDKLEKISYVKKIEVLTEDEKKDIEKRILNLEAYDSIGRDYNVIGETISKNFSHLKELRQVNKEKRERKMIDMYFKNEQIKKIHKVVGGKFECVKHFLKPYSRLRKMSNASKCYRLKEDGYSISEISKKLKICDATVIKRIELYKEYWD